MKYVNYTNYGQVKFFRKLLIEWATTYDWDNPIAVTLTLKQRVNGVVGAVDDFKQNLRHFFNKLNRLLFGNRFKKGARLKAFSVIERSHNGRWHFHIKLDQPKSVDFERLRSLIYSTWLSTYWGYWEMDVSPNGNDKWTCYMMKLSTKPDEYMDCLVPECCYS